MQIEHNVEAKQTIMKEFIIAAPKDPNQYILRYKILKSKIHHYHNN